MNWIRSGGQDKTTRMVKGTKGAQVTFWELEGFEGVEWILETKTYWWSKENSDKKGVVEKV